MSPRSARALGAALAACAVLGPSASAAAQSSGAPVVTSPDGKTRTRSEERLPFGGPPRTRRPSPPSGLSAFDPSRGDGDVGFRARLVPQVALVDVEVAQTDRAILETTRREAFALVVGPAALLVLGPYVEDAKTVTVRGPKGAPQPARVLARDDELGLAVLGVDAPLHAMGLAPFTRRPVDDLLEVGEAVTTVSVVGPEAVVQDGVVLFDGTEPEDLGVARTSLALERGRPAFDRWGRPIGVGRSRVIGKDLTEVFTPKVWIPFVDATLARAPAPRSDDARAAPKR
jgi:hypothetical protein